MIYGDTSPRASYHQGDFEYAIHRGAIIAEVGGNPFAMTGGRFRDLTLKHMAGINYAGLTLPPASPTY
jgi:hypothetical protein